MSIFEIIIFVIGIILTLAGYIYSKIKAPKKKFKTPEGYKEFVGICKKHVEKDGKYQEVFEIINDGKTLKYKFPLQDDKTKLKEIDSIDNFYIKDDEPDVVKHADDFKNNKTTLDAKTLKLCYIMMGVGLALIILTLFLVLF